MEKQKNDKSNLRKKEDSLPFGSFDEKEFYSRVLFIQEEERRRLSRELHDETGQMVVGLGASLNVIEKAINEGNIAQAQSLINASRVLVNEISEKMKIMAFTLRPPALSVLGVSAVLRDYFWKCSQSSQIRIEFDENIKEVRLSEEMEIQVYRIVQEAIYNALKHSQAKKISVTLFVNSKNLELKIKDDGKGFDVEAVRKKADTLRMGLTGIAERVKILNGSFTIDSAIGKGVELSVVLPLLKEQR